MGNIIWLIVKKETIDNLRDRRTFTMGLVSVLMLPLLYFFMFSFIGRTATQEAEKPLELVLIGAEHAPNLVAFLEQNNTILQPIPDNVEEALRAREIDVAVEITEEFGDALLDGQPAPIKMLIDDSNQNASVATRRTRTLIQGYSQQVGSLRLLARGISPSIVSPINLQEVDVAAESGVTMAILNMLATVMLAAAFMGGFYLAIDLTAGERERQSLEPLLMNPAPRWAFVIGKYITILMFAFMATAMATAVYTGLLATPQLQSFAGLQASVNFSSVLIAFVLIIPVIIMAAALEMLIASFADSFKQAQTYVSYVQLFGFLPSTFLAVLPIDNQAWMNVIPTISQTMLISKLLRGEPLEIGTAVLASVITLVVAVGALAYTIRLYNEEKIILGS